MNRLRKWMVLLLVLISMRGAAQTLSNPIQTDTLTVTKTNHWMAAKTNLLYDAALLPTVGVEIPIGRRWSVGADWFYTWIFSDSHHDYWQAYGGYITLRRYFTPFDENGDKHVTSFLTGHHLGIYVLGLTYDVERRHRGYQAARFGFGGGVEYGYSKRIGRNVNLDFSLGIGFQDGEYKEYDPVDGCYVWQATRKRHWWGPTKAEVTIVWLLSLGRKGGWR